MKNDWAIFSVNLLLKLHIHDEKAVLLHFAIGAFIIILLSASYKTTKFTGYYISITKSLHLSLLAIAFYTISKRTKWLLGTASSWKDNFKFYLFPPNLSLNPSELVEKVK
jgi:hypothetical protein